MKWNQKKPAKQQVLYDLIANNEERQDSLREYK